MKKLSIGLFAVLANVFAVTSAFATKIQKHRTFAEWKVTTINNLAGDDIFVEEFYTVSTGYTDLVNDRENVANEYCGSEEDYMCAAFFETVIPEDSDHLIIGGLP